MLTNVDIQNYRGFKSYRMEGLARVNLLVGKNNCGKTALLEGIQFLTSGGEPRVLGEIAARRGEVFYPPDDATRTSPLVDISHFFHGHAPELNDVFSLKGANSVPPVSVRIELRRLHRLDEEKLSAGSQPDQVVTLRIEGGFARESDNRFYFLMRDYGVDLEPRLDSFLGGLGKPTTGTVRPWVQYIATELLETPKFAMLWDVVQLSGRESDIEEAMRVVAPTLDSVHVLTGMMTRLLAPKRGGIVVGLRDNGSSSPDTTSTLRKSATRVPIGSLGDGLSRLLNIACALVSTTDGYLFIDEIDTGLHYSVMADVWKLVVRNAIKANVQVFSSTHSWDCIEGMSTLLQREPDLMDAVAIHKIDSAIKHSVSFQGDSIVRMVKSDIDPR